MRAVLLLGAAALASATSKPWLTDEARMKYASDLKPVTPPRYTVDLDLPQGERWRTIGTGFADTAGPALVNYLKENLPDGWLAPLEKVAGRLMPFFTDYGAEMAGYAQALNLTEGDIVMVNLIYQLEHIGVTCDNWNNTGPVNPGLCVIPGRGDGDGAGAAGLGLGAWESESGEDGPGLCTSFVASAKDGTIYHGRNLDWNLEDVLRKYIITVDFQRAGKTVYTGTTVVGFVGLLHAVKPGAFAWSLNARRKGGSVPLNVFEAAFRDGARTPEQHARAVFEQESTWDDAVTALGSWPLVNQAYFTVSGLQWPEGVVLARDREGVHAAWGMEDEIAGESDWYVGITNYDLDHPQPPADERLAPLVANMDTYAAAGDGAVMGEDDVFDVLETWPTFNDHTDVTAVMTPKDGTFDVKVWREADADDDM